MDKQNDNSTFDFENDPVFNANFNNQIDRMFVSGDTTTDTDLGELDQPKVNKIEEVKYHTIDVIEGNHMEKIQKMDNTKSLKNEEDNEDVDTLDKQEMIEDTIAQEDRNDDTVATKEGIMESEDDIMESEENIVVSDESDELKQEIEDALTDINSSIAKQICNELDTKPEEIPQKKRFKKKIMIGALSSIMALVLIACFFVFTKPGNTMLMKLGLNVGGAIWTSMTNEFDKNVDLVEDVDHLDEEDLASNNQEYDVNLLKWPQHPGVGRKEEGVYNILVLGEESIASGTSRGRTDVIIIATLNTVEKKVKLTSILRDTLVQIPGYNDNKINSVYEKGGIDLLYETISKNFNIHLDGSALVNFENFEKIIDYIGGVEITLTGGEARYLNSTNYISNPSYRNVKEGTQTLNGNQALGYSRVRKRATITGNNNDYGRTDRHRIILNAIFDKYKTKGYAELGTMMLNILPMIKTDIDNATFQSLLQTFIDMRTLEMDQLRIPADGSFTDQIKVRGMDVLVPDINENIQILHEFIFGVKALNTETGQVVPNTATNSSVTNTTGASVGSNSSKSSK